MHPWPTLAPPLSTPTLILLRLAFFLFSFVVVKDIVRKSWKKSDGMEVTTGMDGGRKRETVERALEEQGWVGGVEGGRGGSGEGEGISEKSKGI